MFLQVFASEKPSFALNPHVVWEIPHILAPAKSSSFSDKHDKVSTISLLVCFFFFFVLFGEKEYSEAQERFIRALVRAAEHDWDDAVKWVIWFCSLLFIFRCFFFSFCFCNECFVHIFVFVFVFVFNCNCFVQVQLVDDDAFLHGSNLVSFLRTLDAHKRVYYAEGTCNKHACGGGGMLISLVNLRDALFALKNCSVQSKYYEEDTKRCLEQVDVQFEVRNLQFHSQPPQFFCYRRILSSLGSEPVTFHYVVNEMEHLDALRQQNKSLWPCPIK
jgi:hypothetical protein